MTATTLTPAPAARPPAATAIGDQEAVALAKGFGALGDPARLRLLSLIATSPQGSVCACDLVGPLGKSQPTVSHHLKVLREAGLVTSERRGVNIWYATAPEIAARLQAVLALL